MSLESAIAILNKSQAANPMEVKPGVDPASSVVVEPLKEDGVIKEELKVEDKKEEPKKEEPKVEAKEEEKPKESEQDAKRFAMLAKKEKGLYQRGLELKKQEDRIADGLKAIENFEAHRKEVKNNPFLALQDLGVTYDDITRYALEGKMPNKNELEVGELKQMVLDLRKELDDERTTKKTQEEESAKRNVQETIAGFKQEIVDYIEENQEQYELVKINGLQNLIYEHIESVFGKEKRLITLQDAAEHVEKYAEEQLRRNQAAKKFQKSKETPAPKEGEQKKSEPAQTRTLNNQLTSSAPSFLPAKTENERIQRALAKLATQ